MRLKQRRMKSCRRVLSSFINRQGALRYGPTVSKQKIGAYDKGYVGHKSAKMMKRSKAIEARTEQAIEQKSKLLRNMETAEELKLFPQSYYIPICLQRFSDAAVSYEGKLVCSPVSFSINRGDRIALDGRNGKRKSSILKAPCR